MPVSVQTVHVQHQTNLDAVLVKTLCDVRDCVFKILQQIQRDCRVRYGIKIHVQLPS